MNSTSWQSKFLAKVDSSAGPGACWPWMAGRTGTGYGQFIINSRKYRAHRIAFELHAAQPIPDGMQIDHRCFNRACCNPEHLRLASPKQNGEHRRGAQANNRSGARGVSPHGHGWRAIVRHNGSALYLGTESVGPGADRSAQPGAALLHAPRRARALHGAARSRTAPSPHPGAAVASRIGLVAADGGTQRQAAGLGWPRGELLKL